MAIAISLQLISRHICIYAYMLQTDWEFIFSQPIFSTLCSLSPKCFLRDTLSRTYFKINNTQLIHSISVKPTVLGTIAYLFYHIFTSRWSQCLGIQWIYTNTGLEQQKGTFCNSIFCSEIFCQYIQQMFPFLHKFST